MGLHAQRLVAGLAGALVAAMATGLPADVAPNPWFTRMTPVRTLDVGPLVLTSAALGVLTATYIGSRPSRIAYRGAAGAGVTGLAVSAVVVRLRSRCPVPSSATRPAARTAT